MLRGIGLGTIWAERLEVGYTSPTLRRFMAGRTTLVTHYIRGVEVIMGNLPRRGWELR